jgi:2-oxoglutarate ferredoxin oxidoreductase subunit alpha
VEPELVGDADYRVLVVCWGSTYHVVKEAVGSLRRRDIALLHFSQVYPVHRRATEYLRQSRVRIAVENNATAQFARFLEGRSGAGFDTRILKYDGLPFYVEDLATAIDTFLVTESAG